jgi:hypothetical protein
MKTVVSVYSPHIFGLGDYMRGLMFLMQQPGLHVYAEYSRSPISMCLYPQEPYDGPVGPVMKYEYYDDQSYHGLVHLIQCSSGPLFLQTNIAPVGPTTPEIHAKILEMFSWKPEFRAHMQSLRIPEEPFVVLHVRLHDNFSFGKRPAPEFPNLDAFLRDTPLSNVIVISSSGEYKKRLCDRYAFKCMDVNPVHTLSRVSYEDIRDTLAEMFIVARASHLYQYNQESWQTSGYSTRMSEVFGIPMTRIPT